MKRVPHARGVVQALSAVRTAAQRSLKGLNRAASQRMARGDYGTAEALASKGKEIRQFQLEVEALRSRWRALCGSAGRTTKGQVTPLWSYYQPILKALHAAGGTASRAELEPLVEQLMGTGLLKGDRDTLARGAERWRVMIRRARKHLVAEGWIEDGAARAWRITDAGRRAAEKQIESQGRGG